MKRSVVLLEIIVSLLLFSIVAVVSSKMLFTIVKTNASNTFIVENNLVLETTRLFLTKKKDFNKLKKYDTNLYFDNNLLLKNVSQYKVTESDGILSIDICIYDNRVCQMWKIKK